MSKTGISAILCIGLLAGSVVGVAAQDEADALRLVTEEVEPGVERIISDDAGHDLDETHPNNRLDMDGIAIAPDGTVWLKTTHSGSDNTYNDSSFIWALGQPGTYAQGGDLVILADGTLLAVADDEVLRLDGERFVSDDGPRLRQMADGELLLRIDGADLAGQLSEGEVASIPALHAVSGPDGGGWSMLDDLGRSGVSTGDHWCWLQDEPGWGDEGGGVACGQGWGAMTTYLTGTFIHRLAVAPDGSVWAAGDYDGGPGGLYRITPEPPAE